MTSDQIASGSPSRPSLAAVLIPVLVACGSLALSLATRSEHFFSDGVHLSSMVAGGPKPYYNLAYVPLGWLLHRGLGAPLGLDVAGSLRLFSALSVALSAGLLASALCRRGTRAVIAAGWLTAFVLAPSIRFFATTVEVHALQLLGLSAATLLALSAAELPRRAALARVGLAVLLALSVHLTSALLVPALLLAARGRAAGRGLSVKPGPVLGVLAASAVLAPLLLWLGGGGRMLELFAELFIGRFREGRLYSVAEMLEFTWSEAVLALGLLWTALLFAPFAPFAWRAGAGRDAGEPETDERGELRRLTLVTLVALVPFLLVFPQGGVRERGGYFLSLAPLLVLLGAEATRRLPRAAPLVGLLALALAGVQWSTGRGAPERPVATAWAARAAELAGPGGFIYTTTLPRWHALAQHRRADLASDVVRTMELAPRRLRVEQAGAELAKCAQPHVTGGIYLDRELFGTDLATPASEVLAPFVAALLGAPVRLEAVPHERPLLLRVVPR